MDFIASQKFVAVYNILESLIIELPNMCFSTCEGRPIMDNPHRSILPCEVLPVIQFISQQAIGVFLMDRLPVGFH